MANFLINSPSSETVGTNSNDLFVLQAIQGVSVFGLEGNDTISATELGGSAALLNAGAGNDSVTLTATTIANRLFEGSVFAGSGNDVITASQDFSAAVLRGGSGNDTIILQAIAGNSLDRTTIGGNDNADLLQGVVLTGSNSSFFAAGKGADTINLTFSGVNGFTINAGAGHDSVNLSAAGSLSSFHFSGGDGYDTVIFSAGAAAAISANSNINGDSQDDLIIFEGAVATTVGSATIGGGAGADTIQFSAGVSLTGGFINAGAGLDSVYISGRFNAGTLNGGAGADSITLGTYANSGGRIGATLFGDAGADRFDAGTLTQTIVSGATNVTGGASLGYASFDQSNLSATDFFSAGLAITNVSGGYQANIFSIRQDVVSASIATNLGNPTTFTATNGIATFTSTFDSTVTARVTGLDAVLTQGQVVAFTNGTGSQNYVFIQGGATGGGVSNDLLIQVETAIGGFNIAAGQASSIQVRRVVA